MVREYNHVFKRAYYFYASEYKKSNVVIGKTWRDTSKILLQVNITVKTSLQNGD